MAENQSAYHHANSLTVLNGEQEPRVLEGRMAEIVRHILEWEADIEDANRNVKVTINCSGERAVRVSVEKYQLAT